MPWKMTLVVAFTGVYPLVITHARIIAENTALICRGKLGRAALSVPSPQDIK